MYAQSVPADQRENAPSDRREEGHHGSRKRSTPSCQKNWRSHIVYESSTSGKLGNVGGICSAHRSLSQAQAVCPICSITASCWSLAQGKRHCSLRRLERRDHFCGTRLVSQAGSCAASHRGTLRERDDALLPIPMGRICALHSAFFDPTTITQTVDQMLIDAVLHLVLQEPVSKVRQEGAIKPGVGAFQTHRDEFQQGAVPIPLLLLADQKGLPHMAAH